MTLTRFIGDVHGYKFELSLVLGSMPEEVTSVIQVGDMGVGFGQGDYWLESLDYMLQEKNGRFIRGNHDNLAVCKTMQSWIKDGTVENDVMYIGGAWSIDRAWRIEGYDWWADEELSYEEFSKLIDVYNIARPRVMVTHDCPSTVSKELFIKTGKAFSDKHYVTRTGSALAAMLEIHQPELWIFGHWHCNVDQNIDKTRFICLNEMSYADINLDTLEVHFPEYLNLRKHV